MNLLKHTSRILSGRALYCVAILGTVSQLTGCGPIMTISYIQQTKAELQAAETADAQTLAPYEYTAAVAYLEKTREEHGYADFSVSTDFGEKALKFARSARVKAMEARSEGALPQPSAATSGSVADSSEDEPRLPSETAVMDDEPRLP